MEIDFIGGAYKGQSSDINAQECVNLYVALDQTGGKPKALVGTPGLSPFCDLGTASPVRATFDYGAYMYVVSGNKFFRVNNAGVGEEIDTINTTTGRCYLECNGTQIMLTDGADGWIYTIATNTLAEITDTDFPVPSSLTYQDGYFIVTAKDTGRFYISELYNGVNWDALDYAEAGAGNDIVKRALSVHGELVCFGEKKTYFYANTGAADFPFEKITGSTLDEGCMAPESAAVGLNSCFWLSSRGKMVVKSGYQAVPVSTEQIEYQISTYGDPTDAVGFTYSQNGHDFYQLNFQSADVTWVYDATTGVMHRKASYPDNGRHRANNNVWFSRKNIAGDYDNGLLYEMSTTTYTDNTQPIHRIRAGQTLHSERKLLFHHSLELEFEEGVGLVTGQGSDPQAMLEWSNDDGKTWSNEIWAGIGKIGEYKNRARWFRLGSSRNRVYRVTIADPVKVVIISANLEASAGAI